MQALVGTLMQHIQLTLLHDTAHFCGLSNILFMSVFANFREDRRVHPNMLRHTFATLAAYFGKLSHVYVTNQQLAHTKTSEEVQKNIQIP